MTAAITPAGWFAIGFLTCSAVSLIAIAVLVVAERKWYR